MYRAIVRASATLRPYFSLSAIERLISP